MLNGYVSNKSEWVLIDKKNIITLLQLVFHANYNMLSLYN